MNNKREVFDIGVRAGKRDESGKYYKKKEEVERNLSQNTFTKQSLLKTCPNIACVWLSFHRKKYMTRTFYISSYLYNKIISLFYDDFTRDGAKLNKI